MKAPCDDVFRLTDDAFDPFFASNEPYGNIRSIEKKYGFKSEILIVGKMEKCLGVPVTGRNLNTVNKLVEMLQNA